MILLNEIYEKAFLYQTRRATWIWGPNSKLLAKFGVTLIFFSFVEVRFSLGMAKFQHEKVIDVNLFFKIWI